jgi:uncharacterized protein (TIGR04255 family)
MGPRMKVKYKNPPINELIIGAYFDQPIAPLHSEHIGLFWAEVRSEFPKIQQQPELSLPITGPGLTIQFGLTDEPYPMPRFWLVSEDDTMLMQIQKNAFIFNWRKRDTDYPHFDAVKSYFDRYFDQYSKFLRRELSLDHPNVQVAELTYSNMIETGDYWKDAGDTTQLIPSFSIPDPGVPIEGKPDFNYLTAYKLAPNLTMNLAVRNGRKATEAEKGVLVFEFRALGALGAVSKSEADAWYAQAHDVIGRCFTAMTNPDIQRQHWQPV